MLRAHPGEHTACPPEMSRRKERLLVTRKTGKPDVGRPRSLRQPTVMALRQLCGVLPCPRHREVTRMRLLHQGEQ
jgi:hypothetical protein